MEQGLEIDAGRLLFGLSRIGYTTSSAICDIIDNSVRAEAPNIYVLIKRERADLSDAKRNNIADYIIIDDGKGMNEASLLEALKLGSSELHYEVNSLSKFGLGLKTAAFSQADILEIISASSDGVFNKYILSLPEIILQKRYFAYKEELTEDDNYYISNYLPNSHGTIVKLRNVRKVNHPSVRSTINELKLKLGVIYYYFFQDNGIHIHIEDQSIEAIDPLFVAEADGNLNENEWMGKSVQWIEKPKALVLDQDAGVSCTIEITQLPYPPIFKLESPEKGGDKVIRDKYLINAGNYGFYVYRNKRLIAWASSLQGMIPQEQEYYAFRGRIFIDDNADDYFNIDVKKSNLVLSDEAWRKISDYTEEARYKSKRAWKHIGAHITSILNKGSNEIANSIVKELEPIELLPGDELPTEEASVGRLREIDKDMTSKVLHMALLIKQDAGEEIDEVKDLTPTEKQEAIKGKDNASASSIFRVSSIADNQLWEPYHDADLGPCVRINRMHRFAILIYERNKDNKDIQILFDLLMLQLAQAEIYAYRNIFDYEYSEMKKVLEEFRRISSDFLANLCRKRESTLPPNYKSDDL
jgi:hypothetical protein